MIMYAQFGGVIQQLASIFTCFCYLGIKICLALMYQQYKCIYFIVFVIACVTLESCDTIHRE